MSKCKVCDSEHCQEINTMIKNGITINALFSWCKDKGFKVSQNTLRNHAINHIEGFKFTEKIEVTSDDSHDDDGFIHFEKYCESLGLSPSDFTNLEERLDQIIMGSQKALALLFFKNAALVDHKLTRLLGGKGSYPVAEMKGLRSVYEMYSRVMCLSNLIDPNMAIKTLETMGYTISGYTPNHDNN